MSTKVGVCSLVNTGKEWHGCPPGESKKARALSAVVENIGVRASLPLRRNSSKGTSKNSIPQSRDVCCSSLLRLWLWRQLFHRAAPLELICLSKAPSLLDCLPACFPPPSLALAHPTPNEHPRESWRQKLAAISGVRQSQCHHHRHHHHHWRISTLCKHTVQIGAPIYIIISQEGTKQWMVMVINSAVGNTAQEKEKEKGLGQRAQPTDEKR